MAGASRRNSPNLDAAIAACSKLSDEEKRLLLEDMGLEVTLRAWGEEARVDETSCAPIPELFSRPAKVSRLSPAPGCSSAVDPSVVTGCPWCRRPLAVAAQCGGCTDRQDVAPSSPPLAKRCAYVAALYGASCHRYFLGALVLGWGLMKHGGSAAARVMLHTSDVPQQYIKSLRAVGWTCREVEYVGGVARGFFHNWRHSRFVDVFTKLRALELEEFEKVLLLDIDMLVRAPPAAEESGDAAGAAVQRPAPLESLFELEAPAAMKRGPPVPAHGEKVPYTAVWSHLRRREEDQIPHHQQASGINAGVMLLSPSKPVFDYMYAECRDWYHPEHYATYMPEQEYLSRFYGTFSRWTHISCAYNFEIDKNERVPHDFTAAHEAIRAAGTPMACKHPGAVVLHYSGMPVKPWNLLFTGDGSGYGSDTIEDFCAPCASKLPKLRHKLAAKGPDARLEGYSDAPRVWAAMLEWLDQLQAAADALAATGHDPLELVASALAEELSQQHEFDNWRPSVVYAQISAIAASFQEGSDKESYSDSASSGNKELVGEASDAMGGSSSTAETRAKASDAAAGGPSSP